jgi:hypothetical protein
LLLLLRGIPRQHIRFVDLHGLGRSEDVHGCVDVSLSRLALLSMN